MSTTKKIPMRKCVGCQKMKNKKEMLRVLKTAEGEFILDATGRKNGRGAYLCFSGKCLQEAGTFFQTGDTKRDIRKSGKGAGAA